MNLLADESVDAPIVIAQCEPASATPTSSIIVWAEKTFPVEVDHV
jgi:hypothetical protein